MNILVACEESQAICVAFRSLGFNAFSADLQCPSGGHPEWHVLGDVLPLIDGDCSFVTMDGIVHEVMGSWDLLIAHPPCTYLTKAGSCRLIRNGVIDPVRYQHGIDAKSFFMRFYNARCPHILIENPVPLTIFDLPRYSQIVQPYMFGDPYSKATCLWQIGLPILFADDLRCDFVSYVSTVHGSLLRSKTFPGFARAVAYQYGRFLYAKLGQKLETPTQVARG